MKSDRLFKQDRLKFYSILCGTINPDFISKMKICLTNYGLHAVAVYRFGRVSGALYSRNRYIGFLPLLLYFLLNQFSKAIHHVDIDRRADIGPGLFIMHYYSIIIGPVIIGSNLTVHHNLTIGQRIARLDNSSPEIGNDVWIGPNCVITGGIKIGDGSTISAGTVLSKDIPANSLAAGNPGRIIMHNYDNTTMAMKK